MRHLSSSQDRYKPPSLHERSHTGRERDQQPAARPRVFGLFGAVAGRGECPAPARFTRSKRLYSRTKGPVRPAEGHTFPELATPPCRGAHQTSMPHSCAELPDHIDHGHTAASHTLLATLVQRTASDALVTPAITPRALCTIGCLAWQCKPLVARAAGIEVSSYSRGLASGQRSRLTWHTHGGPDLHAEIRDLRLQVLRRVSPALHHRVSTA